MLAKTSMADVWAIADQPAATPDDGHLDFPWWHALTVEPNGERRSIDLLCKAAEIPKQIRDGIYLPTFSKKICRRGSLNSRRSCAVMPGLLFVPAEIMQIRRREETMKWARVRGFLRAAGGCLAQIRKDQIEIIRQIEARLNMPPEMMKKVEFKIGQRVRFLNDLYVAFLGEATVFEVASDHRIGISGPMLFGSAIKIYVPASEIEAV